MSASSRHAILSIFFGSNIYIFIRLNVAVSKNNIFVAVIENIFFITSTNSLPPKGSFTCEIEHRVFNVRFCAPLFLLIQAHFDPLFYRFLVGYWV